MAEPELIYPVRFRSSSSLTVIIHNFVNLSVFLRLQKNTFLLNINGKTV